MDYVTVGKVGVRVLSLRLSHLMVSWLSVLFMASFHARVSQVSQRLLKMFDGIKLA